MPIYEYLCSSCDYEFEELQRFSDSPVSRCPSCKKRGRVARKMSTSAFLLKGGGWYSDGYSSGGGDKKAKSENGGSSSPESKGDGGTSSSPESKGDGGTGSSPESKSGGDKSKKSTGADVKAAG